MSFEGVTGFINKMDEDEAFENAVFDAVEGKEGDEAAAAVTAIGEQHGFTFTTSEAADAYEMMQSDGDSEEGELSEEALEAVAGGSLGSWARRQRRRQRPRPRRRANPGW